MLGDGLFVHTAKAAEPLDADIQLPNITSEKACRLRCARPFQGRVFFSPCDRIAKLVDHAAGDGGASRQRNVDVIQQLAVAELHRRAGLTRPTLTGTAT